ncbi:hypothetical protein I5M27_13310 [Adhaeribacter sp. BT258]|uniref:Phospholipase_D-nuclease N-terminal n=1 Tax=Adhaeribacter terrigena TaxID=2793070 RepID=A0ABS1C3N4_9BACT|nr:hypothetical protein [Adhaeribacter terrigena]MBK0403967.1 hypothetical protein [Adhaeribacter terrigena]
MDIKNSRWDSSTITKTISLIIYCSWWVYAFDFLYNKDYDNNYAGATASLGISLMALLVIVVFTTGFIVAAIKERKTKRLFWNIISLLIILLIPLGGIFLFENL